MACPLKHAESSARKFGGKAEDYLPVHNWFDESKAFFSDFPTEPYAPAAPNMTTSGCGIRPLCWPLSALLFLPFNYASTRHLFRQDENLGFGTTFAQLRCSCLSGALTPCR
jgi:hypothetical protein